MIKPAIRRGGVKKRIFGSIYNTLTMFRQSAALKRSAESEPETANGPPPLKKTKVAVFRPSAALKRSAESEPETANPPFKKTRVAGPPNPAKVADEENQDGSPVQEGDDDEQVGAPAKDDIADEADEQQNAPVEEQEDVLHGEQEGEDVEDATPVDEQITGVEADLSGHGPPPHQKTRVVGLPRLAKVAARKAITALSQTKTRQKKSTAGIAGSPPQRRAKLAAKKAIAKHFMPKRGKTQRKPTRVQPPRKVKKTTTTTTASKAAKKRVVPQPTRQQPGRKVKNTTTSSTASPAAAAATNTTTTASKAAKKRVVPQPTRQQPGRKVKNTTPSSTASRLRNFIHNKLGLNYQPSKASILDKADMDKFEKLWKDTTLIGQELENTPDKRLTRASLERVVVVFSYVSAGALSS